MRDRDCHSLISGRIRSVILINGQFNPIKILKLVVDIPSTDASCIKIDHLILNAGDIPLAFRDGLRLKFPIAVSGDINLELPILAFHGFRGIAIPFRIVHMLPASTKIQLFSRLLSGFGISDCPLRLPHRSHHTLSWFVEAIRTA